MAEEKDKSKTRHGLFTTELWGSGTLCWQLLEIAKDKSDDAVIRCGALAVACVVTLAYIASRVLIKHPWIGVSFSLPGLFRQAVELFKPKSNSQKE